MDLRALSGVTDFFVIATAATQRQAVAITDAIEDQLDRYGERVWHIEGSARVKAGPPSARPRDLAGPIAQQTDGLSWVLMDCGDLVVHLFNPPAREFYQLERLWGDAPRIPLDPATP